VVAEQDDLVVETADMRVAPGAVRVGAPLEDGSGDMKRARHDAVSVTVLLRADVDEECAYPHGVVRLRSREPDNPPLSGSEEIIERAPSDFRSHMPIM
jgi:hypothetical protein